MTNITNITNIDNLYDVAEFTNSATGGIFWAALMTCIFIILVMNLRQFGIDKAVASASFACLMMSILLLSIGLINIIAPIIFGMALAGTLFYIRWSNR
jgi:4-amino-4-deoxy-L-arabinose transferase-like glycosyltransferase